MRLVVYGPDRRLGALQGEQIVDLNGAQSKYLKEQQNEPLPYEMAAATVPPDLDRFILTGQRGIDAAERAVGYTLGKAVDQDGPKGERLILRSGEVKIHAPYPARTRIMMGGGNFIVHSAGMGYRNPDGSQMSLEQVYAESRKKGIW